MSFVQVALDIGTVVVREKEVCKEDQLTGSILAHAIPKRLLSAINY